MRMLDLLGMLAKSEVDFVLVGGLAVALRGYARFTVDVDVVLAMDAANLRKFIAAAKQAGLHPSIPVPMESLAQSDLIEQWHREKGMLAFSLRTADTVPLVLDVLIKPVVPYAELRQQATLLDVGELPIAVASIEHLIAMKTGTGRSKDQIDIDELRKIQANNE
ncbi:MAG: nucleotidyl transferase AbiEii/AbiGii toxin family protein [Gallionella sp.]|nr:nucleotidyl transferase AbiEii/AbiGii toxin family protein [Gallionella sp.]